MAKVIIDNPALQSWIALNAALRGASEAHCQVLLQEELRGRKRKQFIRRIHSRLNKARADRERTDLCIGDL